MVLPFFEEEPDHSGNIRMVLEDVISALSYLVPITGYEIKRVPLPNTEGYTLDIYFQDREPISAFLEINEQDHEPTYGLLVELIVDLAKRENTLKGLFDDCYN
jgi:hypothetical protein